MILTSEAVLLRCFSSVREFVFSVTFFLKLRVLVHFLRTFHPKSRFPTKMTRGGTRGRESESVYLGGIYLAGRCGNGAEMYQYTNVTCRNAFKKNYHLQDIIFQGSQHQTRYYIIWVFYPPSQYLYTLNLNRSHREFNGH